MRVIVCGGRDYNDAERVLSVLSALNRSDLTIVHGCARGADTLADMAAKNIGVRTDRWPAEWGKYGRGAGPVRNQQMLDAGAHLVIAFPGGRGTADMKQRAVRAGVTVLEVMGASDG